MANPITTVTVKNAAQPVWISRYDMVEDTVLLEGDKINVYWPDGSITMDMTVHIDERGRGEISDTALYLADDSRAYVEISMSGVPDMRVYLRWKPNIKVQLSESMSW
jgi:hypothetical protein